MTTKRTTNGNKQQASLELDKSENPIGSLFVVRAQPHGDAGVQGCMLIVSTNSLIGSAGLVRIPNLKSKNRRYGMLLSW